MKIEDSTHVGIAFPTLMLFFPRNNDNSKKWNPKRVQSN